MLLLFPGENAARDTLRFAEEIAGYGLWQVDFMTGQMTCSPNTYRLLGLTQAGSERGDTGNPLSFNTFEKVAHPDDLPLISEVQHILAEGMSIDRQFRVVHPNGRVRVMAIHGEALVGRDGRPERVVGVLMDISRHVEPVMTSQLNTMRVRELMTALGGAIWTGRPDGFYTDYLLRDSKGALPAQFPGNNWHNAVHPDDIDRVVRNWKKAERDKTIFTSEHRTRGADGKYVWRRGYSTPILADDGSIREWFGISVTIPEYAVAANRANVPLTGAQIRAARGILNWSVRDLASRTGLSVGVVRRLEETDDNSKNAPEPVNLIKDALSAGGVEFFLLPGGEAGVYPANKSNRLKIVVQNRDRKINSAF
ncbi:MAG: PAS domain-containing protein [Pseudolabrys sp.]|nr:PAS domain-containing protein [Pseudolabrys sp.]